MRFLFLDIDGVLNAQSDFVKKGFYRKKNAPHVHTTDGEVYNGISQYRVARLRKIIDATGAKVVLSSSWKSFYVQYKVGGHDEGVGRYLVKSLARKGVEIFDTTKNTELKGQYRRGYGIVNWLRRWNKEHPDDPVEGFVILDDEWFDYESEGLFPWLVKTNYESLVASKSGLNNTNMGEAIKILLSEKDLPEILNSDIEKEEMTD